MKGSGMKEWTPEEIRDFRKRLGLLQKEFAVMLRVTRQYVCYMEAGDKNPGGTMKALLDCLEKDFMRRSRTKKTERR